jgi:hypothetical protein
MVRVLLQARSLGGAIRCAAARWVLEVCCCEVLDPPS